MSRTARTRGLSIQKPGEDSAYGPLSLSSASITVSAPPLKRRRGRPRKNPLQSKNPRTAQAHIISDLAIISTSEPNITIPSSGRLRALKSAAPTDNTAADSVVHKLGKKRKRTLSGDVRPTVLQAVCEGCRRKSYPHGENWKQGLIAICHKCNKEWHAQCMARKGIQRGGAPGQWECRQCSRKGKAQPPRPAHTHDTEAEVMPDQQARDMASETDPGVLSLSTNIVMEELDTPRIRGHYGDLVNFTKITVIQAQKAYEEAKGLLNSVLTKRETCRERFYKLKSEIERYGNGLEEYRRQFHSDGVSPGDGESEHSISHRLALGISGDGDWSDKMSAKIDLMRAEERRLTRRLKSLQDDVKIKKATLKVVEQQRSMFSTCLETSCREFEKLRSKVTMDFIEDSLENSDSFSESSTKDSTEDISPIGIARGIERLAEEANQQQMKKNFKSKDERGQMRALSRVSETVEDSDHLIIVDEFESPQLRSQRSRIVVLKYAPATEVARVSNIRGIDCVSAHPDKADEGEIRGSSLPKQPGPFIAAEAIQKPQGLPQTLEPVQAPKQADTANSTMVQEALSQPSNITIHMSSTSDLVEGRNQRQNVSLATSFPQQPDQSCTPEDSRQTQDPHPVTFVSIPAALAPSSGDFDRPKSSKPSRLSLTPEDTSIITGGRNLEEPHSHGLVLDGMALYVEKIYSADVVVQQRPEHQSSRQAEADLTSISASYEIFRSKPLPPFLGLNSSPPPAKLVHNKVVLPLITSFSPTCNALQSSALPSLTPQTHLLKTSISSNTLG
ncbi:hypothetical protein V501_04781 [Pseudogymnoascus sp. VKM F-4519 (FW-2642)]|nr:hypothetical protein V501_04781 [Pseudogymnoascus sp. VKM F-4519 (FW-2642)]